jgi:hypothetical protein
MTASQKTVLETVKTYPVPEGYALVSIAQLRTWGFYNDVDEACKVPLPPSFADRIRAMNHMYELPVLDTPTMPETPVTALEKFQRTLQAEMDEGEDIRKDMIALGAHLRKCDLDALTDLADWFGDLTVYIRSEAMKYGIPLEEVLEIIMASNESKLDVDGKPIKDENGKFLKGPNYWKPEPKIRELLARKIVEAKAEKG